MAKVLLTCPAMLPQDALDWLSRFFEVAKAGCALSKSELISSLEGVVGLIMGGSERIDLDVVRETKLDWIVFIGIQWETFFSPEARLALKEQGIPVFPTGGGEAAVVRSTLDQIQDWWLVQSIFSRRGKWNPGRVSDLLKNLDAAVIGAGKIGSQVAESLAGKCRSTSYYEALGARSELDKLGARRVATLNEAFNMDIITLHLKFIQGVTENLITAEHLKQIKPAGVVINNARAELISPAELLRFLKARLDVTCIFDVFYDEGAKFEGGLYAEILQRPNFFFTQHTAVTNHLELALPEYGDGLKKVMTEQVLQLSND